MKERLPQHTAPSSEVFFKKKTPNLLSDLEKAKTYTEAVVNECIATLIRLKQDVGGIDDYMLENGDRFESYRAIRNRALIMINKAEMLERQIKQLEHDARTQKENPEGTVQA